MEPGCSNCPVLKTSLFRNMSSEEIEALGCVFRPAHFRRNQILFFEGGFALHLFALHTGLVKVVKSLENGRDRITAVLFPGELFGFESLTDDAYPLTAVALRDCDICAVPRDDFFTYLRTNPNLAIGMVRFLVAELKRVRKQVTDMSFKDARMKVATFLLSLITSDAPPTEGTVDLTLPLSRQEISEALELSPETISRTLSNFCREQLVARRGRHLVIQDRAALETVAHR
ncbi:MAG TPA: Crp/Fnr family transcriptional regulator [Terriglobia bacterium]|nr:Crp/Fnr family transcriptional regulator [Terriglobia bacterium]